MRSRSSCVDVNQATACHRPLDADPAVALAGPGFHFCSWPWCGGRATSKRTSSGWSGALVAKLRGAGVSSADPLTGTVTALLLTRKSCRSKAETRSTAVAPLSTPSETRSASRPVGAPRCT